MACVRRQRSEILADIKRYKNLLEKAYESYEALLSTPNEKNHFDDNEGSQSLTKRKLKDQQDTIDFLEDKIQKLRGELCGRTSIVTHKNYRRISPGPYYRGHR